MTCIVGIEHNGKVYIGGDSAGVGGYSIRARADEKVFVKDDFVIGFTSSFRMGQILRYSLSIPEQSPKKDDMTYLVNDFIGAVRAAYLKDGWLEKEANRDIGGVFLLGYKGKLYRVCSDFQVGRSFDGYNSVGCGEDLAMGSLFSTQQEKDPEKRINLSLEAAAHFSAGVSRPFNIVSI